jgi:methyl-accepting chemotaxis protein
MKITKEKVKKVKINSIKAKMLLRFIPLMLIAMVVLGYISYLTSQKIISSELDKNMTATINGQSQEIQKNLQRHQKIAESLAKVVGSSPSLSKDDYANIITGLIETNDETSGAGVWFEPYKYNKDMDLFGPFAYKDNGVSTYTDEYSKIDYKENDWYKLGKDTDKNVVWSDPYYDDISKADMVTATAPIYDKNNNFIGVATADINLSTLQEQINNIKIGDKGRAFLLDKKGLYLADKDQSKIMKTNIKEDANSTLAALGETMLANKNGQETFKDENGVEKLYYSIVPDTEWIIGMYIPEAEVYSQVNSLRTTIGVVIIISLAVVIFFILLFANYIGKNLKKVNDFSMKIAEGDLTEGLELKSNDELGEMSNNLNDMRKSIHSIVESIMENSENISASAEELSATVEELASQTETINEAIDKIADGMQESNAVTEEISASIEEVDSSINILSSKAMEGSNNANKAKGRATDAEDNSKKVKKIAEDLYVQKKDNMDKVIEESSVIDKISVMADTISSIADQTNLLALNAAIEAARAGEQGKGFSVVADEVRKLAEQSSKSVLEIQNTIKSVKEVFEKSITTGNDILDFINVDIRKNYDEYEETGNQYYSDSDFVSNMTEEIASMSQEVTATVGQVTQAIQNMAETSQESSEKALTIKENMNETTAAIEQVAKTAQNQAELAEKLTEMIQKFKI